MTGSAARLGLFTALLLGLALPLGTAQAEKLIVSVSNARITVTPNYSGGELVLFGSIERDDPARVPPDGYNLVITVVGPRADMVTRRKERRFGIWINADSREFLMVPSYLAVFANRPIDAIAPIEVRRRQQLGISHVLLTQRIGTDYADVVADDQFRTAFVRLRTERGLYRQDESAVKFLTPTLFRSGIPLPAEVPTGSYDVQVKLFSDGEFLTQTETSFEIAKVGFEQFVADAARQDGLLYGILTALMALMSGWMASIVFRRD